MIEWLVIAGCIGSTTACSKASEAYYTYDTPITRYIKDTKQDLKVIYKQNKSLQTTLPMVFFVVKKDATIRINKNWSFRISEDFSGPLYSIGF